MSKATANRDLIEQYLNELSGKPKPAHVVARYVADPELMRHIEEVERSFPEYRLTILQMVAEGEWVAVRAVFTGAQRGEFAGIPPTGREIEAGAVIFYRIQDGRIVEHHLQFDAAAVMAQLQSAAARSVQV